MRAAELPPALRPWSESLAFLTVEAALHIGPLVRRLDALVRRHDAADAPQGEPDGYGGLTTRGHPERLLLSEWLLAEELPLEFFRRAANQELLHIKPSFRAAKPEGSVAVFCDAGPDQLGAPRLVQLAALIVLHRRALARGAGFGLGLSGEPGETWHTGELPELFGSWRRAQSASSPTREEFDARLATVDVKDELWVLAGTQLARAAPEHRLLLHARESAFDEHGVTAVDLRFEGRTTTLHVPTGRTAIQTLRGQLLRRRPSTSSRAGATAISCPSFSSRDRRLLLRGDTPKVLVVTTVPTNRAGGTGRPRLYRFSGPVVAASSLGGRRVIALVLNDGKLQYESVGKSLSGFYEVVIRIEDLLVREEDLDFATLPPLYYDRGNLLFQLRSGWWSAGQDGVPVREHLVVAVAPTRAVDQPQRVHLSGDRLYNFGGAERLAETRYGHDVAVVANDGRVAWSTGGPWVVAGRGVPPTTIEADAGDTVLGVLAVRHPEVPALVTVSASGLLVRVRSETTIRTLTAASGPALGRSLHTKLGLLAVQRDEQRVDVIDVDSGATIMTVGAQ